MPHMPPRPKAKTVNTPRQQLYALQHKKSSGIGAKRQKLGG